MRYCWEAPCEGIDSTFFINMDSYSEILGVNNKSIMETGSDSITLLFYFVIFDLQVF